jgi:Transglycosylase-like domain
MVGRTLAAVVVLFVLPVGSVVLAAPAHAESIDGVESSITSLEATITSQSTKIHQLTSAYQAASLQSTTLTQQISADKSSLGGLHAAVNTSQTDLRQAAIRAYTSGETSASSEQVNANPAVGNEYLSVASGDVSDTVDQLKTQQGQLGQAEANLTQEQKANAAAEAAAAKARSQALATAATEQSQLDSLQSKLQQLQAAAVASQNAKEAAAAEAAEQAAGQGAPVNNGLESTVQAEVSPPTSSAPTTTPVTDPAEATSASPVPDTVAPDTTTTTVEASPDTTTPPTTTPESTATDPTTTTTPPTTEAPAVSEPASPAGGSATPTDFAELAQCESGGNYTENTGNGFYGAYQFSQATWTGLGFPGEPDQEPPAMQDQAAEELQARSGWGQWPACSAALGL